jgi:hypothetical protein
VGGLSIEVSLSTDRLIASLRAQEPEAGSSTTGAEALGWES